MTTTPVRATPGAPRAPQYGPDELADLLGLPPPTTQQRAVITAPLAPAVVVAGAGSGKTETMSARVVWLVANGYVPADRVLGLTFTNAAAAELAARIRVRLSQLRARLGLAVDAGEPTVATYHAYASRLLAEHALRIGVEPSARPLGAAMTWQLAHQVVSAFDGDLPHVDNAETTVVRWVLDLAGELAEHLVTPADLTEWTTRLTRRIEDLPRGKATPGAPYAKVRAMLDLAAARCELLPLVERYEAAKRAAGALDFGDQMALAARIAREFPEVGAAERTRYGVVLLDEYQDTGHCQVVLLRSLFGAGHPVTAVGDPCQSIYGWRGASAGTLTRFPERFTRTGGEPAAVLPLGTSFRNDRAVLTVANRLSEPLRTAGIDVGVLAPGPGSGPGQVRCALLPTVDAEAAWLADQVERVWTADAPVRRRGGRGRSVAVLARRRTQFDRIADALRERGIPVELVGLGGLLGTPEVRDVVSVLRVLHDPAAGDALMRLLAGPRWRIGPRDLAALGSRARELVRTRRPEPRPDAPARVADREDEGSIVEALDDLGDPEAYSPDGYLRLDALRRELVGLRRRAGAPLPDLVTEVERVLRLDIEVAAITGAGRAHLDRFADVAAEFATDADVVTLGAFLAYLDAALARERGLTAGEVETDDDRVLVLTAHGAKGLEWDVVAVPGMCETVFPSREAVRGAGWMTSVPTLPYPLRGDAGDLPDFEPAAADDQKELDELRKDFEARCRERGELEERRLAYVAVTRARHTLLCSGYWWDTATRPRGPAPFLTEVRDVCRTGVGQVDEWAERPAEDASNPLLAEVVGVSWPVDPLGERREAVEAGAALVRAALAEADPAGSDASTDPDPVVATWARDVDLLLAERDRSRPDGPVTVTLPSHLSVSDLVALRSDAEALARTIRRPMPTRPAPMARRGTAFHAWLEERFAGDRLLDLDELPGAADAGAAPDADLDILRDTFLASEWAGRNPHQVEVPFEAHIGGVPVRGRMDAVFRTGDGGWEVVDWKTGTRPTGAAMRAAAVQLAAYRLAWAELAGVPVDRVSAAFHYVRDNQTVRPADLLDAAGLRALLDLPEADRR